MSSPIRPLPIEAASQRTENDAIPTENPSGFEELFDSHIEPEGKQEKRDEKPRSDGSDAVNILGLPIPIFFPQEQRTPTEIPLPTVSSDTEMRVADPPPIEKGSAISSAALLKQLCPVAQGEQPMKVEEIAGKTPFIDQKTDGMPAAKEHAMLLIMEKSAEEGSIEQQQAPLLSEAGAGENRDLSLHLAPRAIRWADSARSQSNEVFAPQSVFSDDLRTDAPAEELTRVEAPKLPVTDLIREHVRVLRVSQQHELQVVLRPDADTELFLHIRNVDGEVRLQARCERGDFAWLDSQWGAIQQSLSAQGVRVEPLESAFRAQNGFSGFNGHSPGSRHEPHRPEPLMDIPKRAKSVSQPNRGNVRGRGWQTWA
jgi:hypothetical protein